MITVTAILPRPFSLDVVVIDPLFVTCFRNVSFFLRLSVDLQMKIRCMKFFCFNSSDTLISSLRYSSGTKRFFCLIFIPWRVQTVLIWGSNSIKFIILWIFSTISILERGIFLTSTGTESTKPKLCVYFIGWYSIRTINTIYVFYGFACVLILIKEKL